jgi:hypothetical protein
MRTFEIVPARTIGSVVLGGESFPVVEVTAGGKRALSELHDRAKKAADSGEASKYDTGLEVVRAVIAAHVPSLRPEVLATLSEEGFLALHEFIASVVEEAAKTGSREIRANPTSPASCA